MVKQSDHFHDLDGMRGVLACAVMLFHLGMDKAVLTVTGGLVDGRWTLRVDFFFILSGFVLAKSFDRQKPTIPE